MTWRPLPILIALAIMSAPLSVEAQQAGRPARIGVLCSIPCQGPAVNAFRRALRELGYIEGRTVVFEYRDAEWKVERLPALAADAEPPTTWLASSKAQTLPTCLSSR